MPPMKCDGQGMGKYFRPLGKNDHVQFNLLKNNGLRKQGNKQINAK